MDSPLIAAGGLAAATTVAFMVSHGSERASPLLPTGIKPRAYDLTLYPDFRSFTFGGKVSISVDIEKPTHAVVMHQLDLEFASASYFAGGIEYACNGIQLDAQQQRVTFLFANALPIGTGQINIAWTGNLNDDLAGFYRSKYTLNGEERYMAVTQFEATDARRCFPCWDEPALKATFTVTLQVPAHLVALSNMPVENEVIEGDVKVVKYQETPIMSTYLLAFAVGEYEYLEAFTKKDVKVRVYTQPGKTHLGQFSLDVAVKALEFLETIFGIDFPLPKCDLIAIPDFAAGAMENFGLITYRETRLLIDATSSLAAKTATSRTVCHELAHMWFGNLVTMQWWTHLWLNEGFARFVEHLCVDHIFPSWDIWSQFVTSVQAPALRLDAMKSSHAIEVEVCHPEEINEIFDLISYAKGASVIRMLVAFIGEKAFRSGLNAYLEKHKYGNAVTEDLWAALGAASGRPVADIMSTWTSQMGYPVIYVEEVEKEGDSRVFRLHQERFLSSGESDASSLWRVPITAVHQHGKEASVLSKRSDTFNVKAGSGDWVKFNEEQCGLYRVRYSATLLAALAAPIRTKQLSARDRLGVQADAFNLAFAGRSSPTAALALLADAYTEEDNYAVLSDVADNLSNLMGHVSGHACAGDMKGFIRGFFAPSAQRLGWKPIPGESETDTLLRAVVLSRMASADDEKTIAESKRLFEQDSSALDADLRSFVYRTAVAHGDKEDYEKVLKIYENTDLQEERNRASSALGAAKDDALIARTLDWALSDAVRPGDIIYPLSTAASSNAEMAWQWLQQKWPTLEARYGRGVMISLIVGTVCGCLQGCDKADEVVAFFEKNPCKPAERKISQAVEKIRTKAAFVEQYGDELQTWLADRK